MASETVSARSRLAPIIVGAVAASAAAAAAVWIAAPPPTELSLRSAVAGFGLLVGFAAVLVVPAALVAALGGGVARWLAWGFSGGAARPGRVRPAWCGIYVVVGWGAYLAIRPWAVARFDLVYEVTGLVAAAAAPAIIWPLQVLAPRRVADLGRPPAAWPAAAALGAALWVWRDLLPPVAPLLVRPALIGVLLVVGAAVAAVAMALPSPIRRRLIAAGLAAAGIGGMAVAGAPFERIARHPAGGAALAFARAAFDGDGDGFSPWLGGGDCDDRDPEVHPLAIERVGNGVDDNCGGGDLARVAALPVSRPTAPRGPALDVVLLSVDALRADHVVPDLTPNLLAFAAGGAQFTHAYASAPHTDLSFRAVFTGWPPSDFDAGGVLVGLDTTLAEILGAAGWTGFALHSVPDLGELITLGFDQLNDVHAARHVDRRGTSAEAITADALSLLRRPSTGPRFVWVHYLEPHHQYVPHAGYEAHGDDLGGLYRQEVAFVDSAMAPLLEWLARPEVAARSVVVLFADHGEYLGEGGRLGHDYTLLEPVLRVPLVIRAPGVEPRVDNGLVSLLDVFPTVIELTGVGGIEPRAGRSLVRTAPPRGVLGEGRRSSGGPRYVAWREGRRLLHCAERDAACDLLDLEGRRMDEAEVATAMRDRLYAELDVYRNDRRMAARRDGWIGRLKAQSESPLSSGRGGR